MENTNLKPVVRFPEFTGDWIENRLGDIGEIKSGGTPNRGKSEFWNGNIPWISTSLINFKDITKANEFITELGLSNSSAKLFPVDTILMAMYGQGKTRGQVAKLKIEASTNQACAAIILKDIVNNDFIYQILSKNYLTIRNLSNEGGQKNLSSTLIRNFKFLIPNSLPEQKKIANFLTSIDERITLLKQKKDTLLDFKKGVMQKIFNQDIRFKDGNGNDFPDWEEKKLGDVVKKMQSGGTPKSTNKKYYDGNIPFLSISDMTSQGKYLTSTKKTISLTGLENSSSWLVPIDTIIYSMYASVGFVSINKIPIATSQAVMNLILYSDNSLEYVYYYLLNFQTKIYKYVETGTQGNINAQIVKNIKIPFPILKEQIKIANYLTVLDDKIDALQQKIDASIDFKKGLLQKMFV